MVIYGIEELEKAAPDETVLIPMPDAPVLVRAIRDLGLDIDTRLQLVMCVASFYGKSPEELLAEVNDYE